MQKSVNLYFPQNLTMPVLCTKNLSHFRNLISFHELKYYKKYLNFWNTNKFSQLKITWSESACPSLTAKNINDPFTVEREYYLRRKLNLTFLTNKIVISFYILLLLDISYISILRNLLFLTPLHPIKKSLFLKNILANICFHGAHVNLLQNNNLIGLNCLH